jgi:uncharacterized protein (DUF1778 family)
MSIALTRVYNVATLGRMKRRKVKAERKDDVIRLRVTSEQKQTLIDAAKAAGLEVSAWLRSLGLREAGRTT